MINPICSKTGLYLKKIGVDLFFYAAFNVRLFPGL